MKTPKTHSTQHDLITSSSQCFRKCAHRFILAGLLLSGIGVQAQLRPSEVWRAVYDTSYGVLPNFFPVDDNFMPPLLLEEDGRLYFAAWRFYSNIGNQTDIVQCTQEGQLTKVGTDYPSDGILPPYDMITAQDVDFAGRLVWTTTEPRTRTFTFPSGTKWDHNNHEIVVNYKAGVTEWAVFVEHPEVLGRGTSLDPWGARDYATFARIADNGDVLVVGRYGHDNGFNDLTDGSIVIRLRASDGQELWRRVDTTASPNVCRANDQGDIWICGGNPKHTASSAMVRYDEHGTNLASGTTTSGPLTGAVDAAGNLYLAELYYESDYDYNSVPYEHDKIRIIKYGPDLSPLWERIHESGTYGPDIPFGITVDPAGNVVVVGTTCRAFEHQWDSVLYPVEGCNHGELLALKLNGSGTWLWDGVNSTAVGYVPTDFDVDSLGNVYLCALQDFPYTPPDTYGWAAVRFAGADGAVEWSLQNELPNPPTPAHGITGIAVDDSDFVYLAGTGGGFWTAQDHSDVILIKCEQIAAPVLVVDPTSIAATCYEGENASSSHFDVWNGGGGGALDYVVTENIPWLSVTPGSGSSTGELDDITVNYSSSALAPGTYTGTISVSASGVNGSPQTVDVTLNVLPPAVLSVNPLALNPTCPQGQNATNNHFEVWNSGGGEIDYTVSETLSWLSCTAYSGTSTGEHDTITVKYSTSGLTAGIYNGTITVSAPGVSGSPKTISVVLTVPLAPELMVGQTNLTETHLRGFDYFRRLTGVKNSGGGSLDYTITENLTWLSCMPTSGTLGGGESDGILIEFDTAELAFGTHHGTITVSAPGVSGSPQTIEVTMNVITGDWLWVFPQELSFSIVQGQNPAIDSFDWFCVENWGVGTINYTVSESISWLSCTPTSGSSSGEYDTIDIIYDTTGLAPGIYQGMITADAPGVSGSPQTVEVNLTVFENDLRIHPWHFNPSTIEGQNPASNSFYVSNMSPGVMDYTVSADMSWLTCVPTSGSSSGEDDRIDVIYDTAGLPPGFHRGLITVSAPSSISSPRTVYVTLEVQSESPGSSMFLSLGPNSDTIMATWPGGTGIWLEQAPVLHESAWSMVPGSEGISQMEVPLMDEAGFFRVAVRLAPPVITQQPVSVAVPQSGTALFSASASGAGPLTYQWHFEGAGIPGATNSTLTLEDVQPAEVGDYGVTVSHDLGVVTSTVATLALSVPYGPLVWVPPGTFLMGGPASELDRDADEEPQTEVTLSQGFWVGAYEVTQRDYSDVMGSNPSHFTNSLDQPVEFLTWEEATNYCYQLTLREKGASRIPGDHEYRLPTEAEWEYVCRAGTTTRFSHGDDPRYTELSNYAWITNNSDSTTHSVGQKPANPWGVHDLYGNVWEWCQDWYTNSYSGGAVTDPLGPASGDYRIVRGGSYYYGAAPCRSANRGGVELTGARWDVGLRVVLSRTPQVNLLLDPGFESGADGRVSDWLWSGNVYQESINARTGAHSLKLYGNWTGPWNTSFALQNLPAAAGEQWTSSGYAKHVTGDLLGWDNYAVLKIAWFDGPDGTGNLLQPLPGPGVVTGEFAGVESPSLNSGSSPDVWHPLTVSAVAPPGTMSVQTVILFVQSSDQAGAAWFDDVNAMME